LSRPGGNVTGVTFYSGALGVKQLEPLRELVPKANLIGMLINPTMPSATPQARDAQERANALGLRIHTLNAGSESDFEAAFATLAQLRADALLVAVDQLFDSHPRQLVALATRYAVPAVYNLREFVAVGANELRRQHRRCLPARSPRRVSSVPKDLADTGPPRATMPGSFFPSPARGAGGRSRVRANYYLPNATHMMRTMLGITTLEPAVEILRPSENVTVFR
jgi:hypothetical protein